MSPTATMVKERPILFSGPMVRAILEGRKTQTRRVIKPQPESRPGIACARLLFKCRDGKTPLVDTAAEEAGFMCPYGQSGDRLWVRETWAVGARPDPFEGCRDGIEYRADEIGLDDLDELPLYSPEPPDGFEWDSVPSGWRPSIFMPRWASRIDLEITDVRVERLQEISPGDAFDEGFKGDVDGGAFIGSEERIPRFRDGWDKLNAKRGFGWDTNPWVWVLTFKRIQAAETSAASSNSDR